MAVWSIPTLHDVRATRRIDSEFFRPDYVAAEGVVRASKTDDLGKLGGFVPGPFGSAFHVQNYDYKSPYRYIRGRDVKPFFLLKDDNRYIPESDFNRLKQYEVHNDDLMISVVGTLGNVAVCTEKDTPAMFSCKSTLLRVWRADPYFLLSYLNSTPGQLCLLRRQRGAIQTGLNIEDLRTIPVPRFKAATEDEIAASVRTAHRNLLAARDAYHSAQQLLDSELGLDKLTFQKPVGYTARLSDLETSHRSDAEFYNPELRFLWAKLSKKFYLRGLPEFVKVTKFANPDYGDNGFPIVTQKHLRSISPEGYGDDLRATTAWGTANLSAILRTNDLLFYSVGAYLGKTNIWLNSDEAVPASFITLLRCHEATDSGFLQVLLNSRYGLLQSKCFQSGTSQQYIYPKDIRRFLVPDVRNDLRKQIHMLVLESYAKEQEAKALLEQAKARVEQLIEEAMQP